MYFHTTTYVNIHIVMSCGYMTKTESILTFIQISSFVVINRFCGNQDCAISAVD